MKIVIKKQPRMTIEEFSDKHGLVMKVVERSPKDMSDFKTSRYYAMFESTEVNDDGCLASFFGNGSTPTAAIYNYANRISGCRLVVNAYLPERREIVAPILIAKKGR